MDDQLAALLQQFPPEVLEQMMGLSTMDDKASAIQQQMAMARELGQQGTQRTSPIGAALGGLGNAVNGVSSVRQTKDLQGQQSKLMDDQLAARMAFIKALQGGQGGGQPPPAPPPQGDLMQMLMTGMGPGSKPMPPMPFGFGGKGPMP